MIRGNSRISSFGLKSLAPGLRCHL
jgi:hypothetical protein